MASVRYPHVRDDDNSLRLYRLSLAELRDRLNYRAPNRWRFRFPTIKPFIFRMAFDDPAVEHEFRIDQAFKAHTVVRDILVVCSIAFLSLMLNENHDYLFGDPVEDLVLRDLRRTMIEYRIIPAVVSLCLALLSIVSWHVVNMPRHRNLFTIYSLTFPVAVIMTEHWLMKCARAKALLRAYGTDQATDGLYVAYQDAVATIAGIILITTLGGLPILFSTPMSLVSIAVMLFRAAQMNLEAELSFPPGIALNNFIVCLVIHSVCAIGGRHSEHVIRRDFQMRVALEGIVGERTAELRKQNKELVDARAQAESANRAKSDFLACVTHELKTPLSIFVAALEMTRTSMQEERKLVELIEPWMTMMESSSEALRYQIDAVLDVSRIESRKLVVQSLPFSLLNDVVRPCLELSKGLRLTHQNIEMKWVLNSLAATTDYIGDAQLMRQVAINMISNAFKFSPDGGLVQLRFTSELTDVPPTPPSSPVVSPYLSDPEAVAVDRRARQWHRVLITVSDTGVGIPSDRLSAVLDMFTQSDSTIRRRFGGSGLGLYISNRIAQAMHGGVTAESAEGKGSQFTAELLLPVDATNRDPGGTPLALAGTVDRPATTREAAFTVPASPPRAQAEANPEIPRRRILLVDDNPHLRILYAMHLETHESWDVTPAEDGSVAVDLHAQALRSGHPFDLVVMDLQMPVMDGVTAIRQIRAREADAHTAAVRPVPIIALSAHSLVTLMEETHRAGAAMYLIKPISHSELVDVVAQHLPSDRPRTPELPPAAIHDASESSADDASPVAVHTRSAARGRPQGRQLRSRSRSRRRG